MTLLLVAVLWALFGAAGAFLVVGIVAKALPNFRDRYKLGHATLVSRDVISEVILIMPTRDVRLLACVLAPLGIALGLWLGGPFLATVLGVAFFVVPGIAVRTIRERRMLKFNEQLVDALAALSNALRAGLSFAQAIEHVAREMRPPISLEFDLYLKEVRLGVMPEDALQNMATRVGLADLDLLVTATNIARGVGGNLAEIFDTIASTVRERFRVEGHIRSTTAMARRQGQLMAILPWAMAAALNWLRPDLMRPVFESLFGWLALGLVIFLELVGFLIMRRIIHIAI